MTTSKKMDFEKQILPALKDALIVFKNGNDLFLLKVDANERSITHRFATYLSGLFGEDFQTDCEYNRVGTGGDKKALHMYEKEWAQLESQLQSELAAISSAKLSTRDKLMSEEGLTVYPDIIVHQRGNNDNNLLVIEAKKTKPSSSLDMLKLKQLQKWSKILNHLKNGSKQLEPGDGNERREQQIAFICFHSSSTNCKLTSGQN